MTIREGKSYDVIVAGAGSAGFCAAVQAGRLGASVALFDKYAMPGGTMTVLGNAKIDEFNNPRRKPGDRMIIKGIGWELVEELQKRGYASNPDMDGEFHTCQQYGIWVNPVAAAQCMDDFLLDAGVAMYLGQPVVDVETAQEADGTRVESVIVSTKEGLVRFRAKIFIDCSGDGDLCVWAGAPFEKNEDLQPGTMRLYLCGEKADWRAYEKANEIWKDKLARGEVQSEELFGDRFDGLLWMQGDNANHVSLDSADSESRTQAEIRERRSMLHLMDTLKAGGAPMDVVGCAPETAPRESRRIMGDVVMTQEEYLSGYVYDDAICYTYWFVDIHRGNNQPTHHVYLSGEETPTISLGALRPQTLKNVYVAGRCASADRECASAIRVKASCMAMGQAAGAAAGVGIKMGLCDTRGVPVSAVRACLREQGAIVPPIEGEEQ